jgi:hypothetical protein
MLIIPHDPRHERELIAQRTRRLRIALYGSGLILLANVYANMVQARQASALSEKTVATKIQNLSSLKRAENRYQDLKKYLSSYPGTTDDAKNVEIRLREIDHAMAGGNYAHADYLIARERAALEVGLDNAQQIERIAKARKGMVSGVVRDGSGPVAGATVAVLKAGLIVVSATTGSAGIYALTVDADTYVIKVSLAGYVEAVIDPVVINGLQTLTDDVMVVKVPPPPTPQPTPQATPVPIIAAQPISVSTPAPLSDSTSYSTYRRGTISASSGTFTADIMTFDLASGHIKVMEDTADDGDCANNCLVKSVSSFVQQDGGFAGINGTYFCPTAYGSSCAGKTNSFYWKQYNSRIQKMINPDNGLGDNDPFIVFDENGHATFLRRWIDFKSSGLPIFAGISCTPAVVVNGNYAIDESTLDTKQLTAKISRGAIGLKGQTLYVVTVQGATVMDLGHAMQALGLDNAINVDAGGSSGMVYKNNYKLGPGRGVPNVLVFAER